MQVESCERSSGLGRRKCKQQGCVVTERIVTRLRVQIASLSKNYVRKLSPNSSFKYRRVLENSG